MQTMIVKETKEMHVLATCYICAINAVKKGSTSSWHLDRLFEVIKPLKALLMPYRLTKEKPYSVNIDEDLYHIYFSGGELECIYLTSSGTSRFK